MKMSNLQTLLGRFTSESSTLPECLSNFYSDKWLMSNLHSDHVTSSLQDIFSRRECPADIKAICHGVRKVGI